MAGNGLPVSHNVIAINMNDNNLLISLRPLRPKDSSTFHRWISDKEIVKYSLSCFLEERDVSWVESYIQKLSAQTDSWNQAIDIEGEEEPIGYCGLTGINKINRCAEYYILIGNKCYWNHGFGTQAGRLVLNYGFETMMLNRIWLTVYEENAGALRCYNKLGFTEEGRLRQATFRHGCFHDKVVLSILREEWLSPPN